VISKEQFNLWKHEPVTKWFFEFLKAKQEFMKSAALEQWVGGSPWPETVRGQIIELDEIANIEQSAILAFYGIEEDGTESKGSVS
jgi:hypothetical protein